MINILPEFESRQVLTSDELNWMACYLDTQNRQTRRVLIGCGLIGGLQVRLVNNSIQVTNGIGVTSAGHIVSLMSEDFAFTTYTRVKRYTQKANEKLAYHYLPDLDPNAENYVGSVDVPSLYFPGFKGDIWELFEENVNDADQISGAVMNGKVAVLFAEILQKELKDCEGENCQERGKKYLFNTKVLVLSKEDALVLLNKEYNIETQLEDNISAVAFPWLHLPNMNILRPVFSNTSVNAVFDEKIIVAEYKRCIKDLLDSVGTNEGVIEQALQNLKQYCSMINGNANLIGQLLETVKSTGVLNNSNQSPALSGLVYDYLWCIVKAYQELQAEAQHLKAKSFTQEAAFPNHILMGVISNQNADFETPVSGGYSIYRHSFQSRLVQTQQAEVCKRIRVYFNRINILVTGFDLTTLANKKELRITAGGNLYDPLSMQAIPYYLKQPNVMPWSAWSAQANLGQYITTYGGVNENQLASYKIPYNTQPSAFQGNHAFFRIEGVYGQAAVSALNAVFQLRKKHGLAFEVLMLRINEKAPFSHSFNFTINEDIESMYQVVRAEVMKQISLNVSYLGGLQFKSGKFAGIQDALTKELEKSYLFFLKQLNIAVLAEPLMFELNDAIMASNITSNYKSAAYTVDAKYSELETIANETKAVANSYIKKENATINAMKFNTAALGIYKPGFVTTIGVLFFNTLGNLVNTIKSSTKFKDSSDISFYGHLLSVAKALQKNEKQKLLFLYLLRLYCALKLQEEYLAENFLELDVTKYQDNLEDELLPASDAVMDYLRPITTSSITNDEILYEIIRDEMMEYTGRVKFDDDWIKIIQLDAENKKRNGGLGVENLLEKFVKLHPGIAHGCGVPKGGTYLMVYDAANQVIADFYLPYIISSHLRPIQYTLLENKTLTLSGFVKDATGKPIATSLLIGSATIVSNAEGFYNALVNENSTVKIVCKTKGYKDFEKDVTITDKPVSVEIALELAAVAKFTTTITFNNQLQQPIGRDITLLRVETNETAVAAKGILTTNGEPKKTFGFMVKDDRFEDKRFEVVIGEKDQTLLVQLVEVDIFRIQLIGEPDYRAILFNDIKVTDPEMEVDTSGLAKGIFVTKQKMDLTKNATVTVIYNKKKVVQQIKPGEEFNKVPVEGSVNEKEQEVTTVASVLYSTERAVDKIKFIPVNNIEIAINLETDTGKGVILSEGGFDLRKMFNGTKPISIPNFASIKGAILVIDTAMTKDINLVTDKSFFTFTIAPTAAQVKSLVTKRKEFAEIAREIELRVENFYCLLMPAADIKAITTILKL